MSDYAIEIKVVAYIESLQESVDQVMFSKSSVIVEEEKLLKLFKTCLNDDCSMAVDPDNIELIRNGAFLRIKATCNNSHVNTWESSTLVGKGHRQYPVINLNMVK